MITRYDLAYYAAVPVLAPYLAYRSLARGKYRDSALGMLGGSLPKGDEARKFDEGCIWIHACSVGETVAAQTLAPLLHQEYPDLPLVISTVTETGQAHAQRVVKDAARTIYFPIDFSWNVRRYLRVLKPRIVVVMETEIWPNFLTLAAGSGARIFLANGKLSENSFKGYGRLGSLLRPAFDAIEAFCMQTDMDAQRMAALCGRSEAVMVTGNCKFDTAMPTLDEAGAAKLRARYGIAKRRPTLVTGSTHPGEEEIVLGAFAELRKQIPDAMLILSPRHPERFDEAFDICRRAGGYRVSRATQHCDENPDVFVLDTMGELATAYGLGDVAVVAGSFNEKVGGHNLMEAAAHAIPVVVGPEMWAQKEIDRLFRGEGTGCIRVTTSNLSTALCELFSDAQNRARIGENARMTAMSNQGAAARTLAIIRQRVDP